ncbi:HNH endonuclease [Paraclostridium bifermentans]|uniref:HNH endonuclease n=1 Tax=Paraclostridium bifermentans TaxID=1490 RepID=UPI00387B1CBF
MYIINPYNKEAFINEIKGKREWEDSSLKYYKKDILTYLYKINKGNCYYCKTKLSIGDIHIEHIMHKEKYSIFTYHPVNLTISCKTCNTNKGTKIVLKDDKLEKKFEEFEQYPNDKDDFKIVHAYLDTYDDHIEFQDGWMIRAIGNKGKNTIEMCYLNRHELALEKKKRIKLMKSKVDYAKKMISGIGDESKQKENILNIINGISLNTLDIMSRMDEDDKYVNFVAKEFIKQLSKDKIEKRIRAREYLINLNDEKCSVFELACDSFKNDNDNFSSDDLIIITEILDMLEKIFDKSDYRDIIKFITDDDSFSELCEFDDLDNCSIDENQDIELMILKKFNLFIRICRCLDSNKIKDSIKKMKDSIEKHEALNL